MAGTAACDNSKNLIEEYMIGATRVRIYDDYIIKDTAERNRADERIAVICRQVLVLGCLAAEDI
jgi:hypothetical protein